MKMLLALSDKLGFTGSCEGRAIAREQTKRKIPRVERPRPDDRRRDSVGTHSDMLGRQKRIGFYGATHQGYTSG
jgi:hypothetical protein